MQTHFETEYRTLTKASEVAKRAEAIRVNWSASERLQRRLLSRRMLTQLKCILQICLPRDCDSKDHVY